MAEGTRERRLHPGTMVLAAVLFAGGAALLVVAVRGPAAPATMNDRVHAVAATLRCPVCQDLSVADSPSPVAQSMRDLIAQELRAGWTPQRIRAQFVGEYGQWILLAPPRRGIDLVAWLVPVALLLGGMVILASAVRRWTAARPGAIPASARVAPLSAEDRLLLQKAMATLPEDAE